MARALALCSCPCARRPLIQRHRFSRCSPPPHRANILYLNFIILCFTNIKDKSNYGQGLQRPGLVGGDPRFITLSGYQCMSMVIRFTQSHWPLSRNCTKQIRGKNKKISNDKKNKTKQKQITIYTIHNNIYSTKLNTPVCVPVKTIGGLFLKLIKIMYIRKI